MTMIEAFTILKSGEATPEQLWYCGLGVLTSYCVLNFIYLVIVPLIKARRLAKNETNRSESGTE